MSSYNNVDLGGLKNKKKPVPRMSISYTAATQKSVSFDELPDQLNLNRGDHIDSPDSVMKDLGYNPFAGNCQSPSSMSNITSSIPGTPVDLGGLRNKKVPVKRMSVSYNPKDPNFARYEVPASPHHVVPPSPSVSSTPRKGGPSASLTALTGATRNRRSSFGMVSESPQAVRQSAMKLPPAVDSSTASNGSSLEQSAVVSSSPGPSFMKGTSSTRCRRASFDLHCLDQAGGSLSASNVLHRSYLNDQGLDASAGKLTTAQLAANNSYNNSLNLSAGQQHALFLQQRYPGVDIATAAMSQRIFEAGVQNAPLREVNEDPRYSIYHPRYRMPQNIFGFSKPFVKQLDIKKQHFKSNFAASTTSFESLITPRRIVDEREAFRKSIS